MKYIRHAVIVVFLLAVSVVSFALYEHIDLHELTTLSFYQSLANPSVRIVKIPEGSRKEEVAEDLTKDLGWNQIEKKQFLNGHLALGVSNLEGYYFPKTYLIDKNASPVAVTNIMVNEFNKQTKGIKKSKNTTVVNQDTILKIASIIQREAGGKADMALISGIIWNRLFNGMKLQMDATLQYVKGDEANWWPPVTPDDKKLNSPYNTYRVASLPPTPISNPGLAAIQAAYNPQKTSCLFYIHDKSGHIHCSTTYEGQVNNIKRYY